MTAVLLAAVLFLADDRCFMAKTTGYVRSEGSSHTYDGTSIWEEGIVAASWDIPLQSIVDLEGLGRFRVADRGMLGSAGWFDVAVWTRAEAYAITGHRRACVYPPGAHP